MRVICQQCGMYPAVMRIQENPAISTWMCGGCGTEYLEYFKAQEAKRDNKPQSGAECTKAGD